MTLQKMRKRPYGRPLPPVETSENLKLKKNAETALRPPAPTRRIG